MHDVVRDARGDVPLNNLSVPTPVDPDGEPLADERIGGIPLHRRVVWRDLLAFSHAVMIWYWKNDTINTHTDIDDDA